MSTRSMRHLTTTCAFGTLATLAACSTTHPEPAETAKTPAAVPRAAACARIAPGVGASRITPVRQSSSVALASVNGKTLAYIADADSSALLTMDVDDTKQLAATPLSGTPEQVLVLADGRVAVSLRDRNRVQILEPAAKPTEVLATLCEVATHAEPVALALTPDDSELLVTSGWGRRLAAYDAATGAHRYDVQLSREPRAVVVDDSGERAFVSHVVGAKMSVVELNSNKHDVREIDLRVTEATDAADKTLRGGCQGFSLAKSIDMGVDSSLPAGRIFAPMVTVDPGNPEVTTGGYGDSSFGLAVEAPLVSVIDADAERALTVEALPGGNDQRDACILPRGAAVSGKMAALYVTCLGNDALVELDARAVDPSRAERRRWLLPTGPTGVAVDERGERAAVWSQFARALSVVSLKDEAVIGRAWAEAGAKSLNAKLARGRAIFHDTDDMRIARDGRACASCHPDGREDALTWSTPVGPRQTIMLAGRINNTGPYSWLGTHKSLEVHLNTTFERLGGNGFVGADEDLNALLAYLEAMPTPVTTGALVPPEHVALARRGKLLFHDEAQGCSNCHLGASGTDAAVHNVASRGTADAQNAFDTPSLRFVGGTAPYFHDGRYATLRDLLRDGDSAMGHSFHLSQRDVAAMSAYLETL